MKSYLNEEGDIRLMAAIYNRIQWPFLKHHIIQNECY